MTIKDVNKFHEDFLKKTTKSMEDDVNEIIRKNEEKFNEDKKTLLEKILNLFK